MRERIYTSELGGHLGEKIVVQGWLHALRKMGEIAFLILRDGSGICQAVLDHPLEIGRLDGLQTGTVLRISGTVCESRSELKFELQEVNIEIINAVTEIAPVDISKKKLNLNLDTLLDNRVLTLRHPSQQALFRIYAHTQRAIRQYLEKEQFTEINTPKIIAAPTEGGAEIFQLDYFGRQVCLAQSPQFYKQIMVGVFERVYEIGKAYRAESSHTSRHLTEINMLDLELGFLDNLEDLLNFTEKFLFGVLEEIWQMSLPELQLLSAEKPLLSEKFPRITLSELHRLYLEATGRDLTAERDASPEEEKFICQYSRERWQSEAVFITAFPWSDAKFYHKRSLSDPQLAERADLLFRGVEIATVPLREENYQKLCAQMVEKGIDPGHEGFKYYLEAFRYGLPPHGGFGMGIARLVAKITGLENVKEAELFPRDTRRVAP